MKITKYNLIVPLVLICGIAIGIYHDVLVQKILVTKVDAKSSSDLSPTEAVSERDVYYPGTEALKPDEMRVIACGTGMPNARPKQAAACWLVELGNGDKFLFDIGSGSLSAFRH